MEKDRPAFCASAVRAAGDHIVGRFPIHAAGDVGKFGGKLLRFDRVDLPAQSGFEEKAVGGCRKERRAGKLELHPAIHFDQRLAWLEVAVRILVGVGLTRRTNDLALDGVAGDDVAIGSYRVPERKLDGLALVFVQQPVLCNHGCIVVLLDDSEGGLG